MIDRTRTSGRNWPTKRMLVEQGCRDCLLVLAAYALATLCRRLLPIGRDVGTSYVWFSLDLYLVLLATVLIGFSLLLACGLGDLAASLAGQQAITAHAVFLAVLSLTVFFPMQSGVQKAYFVLIALVGIGISSFIGVRK